jgi:hypothetical protein
MVVDEQSSENTYTLPGIYDPGSPIIVKDILGNSFTEVVDSITIEEDVEIIENKYIHAKYNNIDTSTIFINDELTTAVTVINNIIVLPTDTNDSTINIRYKVNNSFVVYQVDGVTKVTVHGGMGHGVYFEVGSQYTPSDIDINPLRSSGISGFLYIKE